MTNTVVIVDNKSLGVIDNNNSAVVVQPSGPSTVIAVSPQQGPTGPSGGAVITYPLNNVSTWTQLHDYSYYPNVTLLDASGQIVLYEVQYPDTTHVYISFPTPFTGTAVLR